MKFDSTPLPTPPTPEQLAELSDVLVTAAELERLYEALTHHPRVLTTPGSSDVFLACHEQIAQDLKVLEEQADGLLTLSQASSSEPDFSDSARARKTGTLPLPPRMMSFPDVEPPDMRKSVFDTVKRAFHLEDFLLQQLNFSLVSAQDRQHLKLQLQLKMIVLSAQQRCHLLEERYGFARSKSVVIQGLRRQTTRILARLQGEKRHDID